MRASEGLEYWVGAPYVLWENTALADGGVFDSSPGDHATLFRWFVICGDAGYSWRKRGESEEVKEQARKGTSK